MVTSSNPDQRPKAAPFATTDDAFLGGRVQVLQPRKGFRAGLDAVMLAAAVPARAGDRVCELGAGVGTAGVMRERGKDIYLYTGQQLRIRTAGEAEIH